MQRETWGLYRGLSVLGQGGMGLVLLAEHTETGEAVALKTLVEPHALLIHTLRREIRTLKHLTHPGVVRIIESGERAGVPWYAMELLRGETLGQHIDSNALTALPSTQRGAPQARTLPATDAHWLTMATCPTSPFLPEEMGVVEVRGTERRGPLGEHQRQMLGWVGQLCRALTYLHAEGVVHSDLKPDNILITESGRAVLMDFGIVTRFGSRIEHDALFMAGMRAGTVHYMAPERIRGWSLDARADLYALGCILYEIVSGRVPFSSTNMAQVLEDHLSGHVASLRSQGSEIPEALDDLISRLLAKRPASRPGHTRIILNVLDDMGIDTRGGPVSEETRAHLLRAPLIGRERLVAGLEESLRQAIRGEGRTILVGGDSGVGKTRLAAEIIERARWEGVEVLISRCEAGALGVFRPPLRRVADLCVQEGAELTARILGPRGRILAPYAPFLDALPGQAELTLPAPLPRGPARLRVFRALVQTLDAFCRGRAMLFVLDDLHLADALSLDALSYLATQAPKRPWMVLGLYGNSRSPESLGLLVKLPGIEVRSLRALRDPEVGEMIAGMLGVEGYPEALASVLTPKAEGNPFFVAEYLRAAVEQGWIVMDRQGAWRSGSETGSLPVPRSVLTLVTGRVEALEGPAEALCGVAAVLGERVDLELLERVAQLPADRFDGALERLVAKRILEEDGPFHVRFAHNALWAVAHEALEEGARRRLHWRAAEILSHRMQKGLGVSMRAMARHWEGAGEVDEARSAYLQAAQEALRQHAVDEAESALGAALLLFEDSRVEALEARLELASKVLAAQGRLREAEAIWRAVLVQARAMGGRAILARCLLELGGEALTRTSRHKEAFEALREARGLYRDIGDRGGEARALHALANIHLDQSRYVRAVALYTESLEIHRQLGDRAGEGAVLHNLANIHLAQSHYEEALGLYRQSLAIDEALGDKRGESVTLNNMATARREQGRLAEARGLYEASLVLRRVVVDRRGEGVVLNNLANIHLMQGQYEGAIARYEEALEIRLEVGNVHGEGITRHNMANVRRLQGQHEAAMVGFERALALHRQVGHKRAEGVTRLNMACIVRAQGRVEEALAAIDAVLVLCREVGDRTSAATAEMEAATCLRLLGRHESATLRLDTAAIGLEDVGDRLGLALCACERGHLKLEVGADAQAEVQEAQAAMVSMGANEASQIGQAIEALREAITCQARTNG